MEGKNFEPKTADNRIRVSQEQREVIEEWKKQSQAEHKKFIEENYGQKNGNQKSQPNPTQSNPIQPKSN